MLYALAGRIFLSIDFFKGENPDKDCTSATKKIQIGKFSKKLNFRVLKPLISLLKAFQINFNYF